MPENAVQKPLHDSIAGRRLRAHIAACRRAADQKFLTRRGHTEEEFLIEKRHEIQMFASALWYPKFVPETVEATHEFRIPGTSRRPRLL